MSLLILYFFLALSISFLCSLMESVLLSIPISYLKVNEGSKKKGIHKLYNQKLDIEKNLSAILSLNTIANTIGAAGVGAQATKVFGEAYFGVISALLTIMILVFSEIFPKTIGAKFNKKLAPFIGHLIHLTSTITYPLVKLSSLITKIISNKKTENITSREELSALATIGAKEGIIKENENKIIQNLIKLKTIRADEIMTPRIVLTLADEELTIKEFLSDKEYLKFSRIPVFKENDEHITGYVSRQNIFEKFSEQNTEIKLKDIKREICVVPNTIPVFDLWELLLEKKEHICIVVDEFGTLNGIVTLEDIIETLVGIEIMDEKDTIADLQQYARDRWKIKQTKYNFLYNKFD